jgi:hypothetical protein
MSDVPANVQVAVGFLIAAGAARLLLDFREEFEGVRMGIYSEREKAQILDDFAKRVLDIVAQGA